MCRLISSGFEYKSEPPTTEKELSDWEKQNGITIPEQYKERLLLTRLAYIRQLL